MIGIYGKDNQKGLGILTKEYVKHLPIERVLIREDRITDHSYKNATYWQTFNYGKADKFLEGLDTLFILEMYDPKLLDLARKKKVRTILKVNYEFLPQKRPIEPDLYLCSSSLNYKAVATPNKVLIPDPVNVDLINFSKRQSAQTFVHNAGNTLGDANGTDAVIEAQKHIKSKAKLEIREFDRDKKYYELYDEGDVLLLPQRFRATSLPIQEAMAAGMPVMTTNIEPFNEFCQILFEPDKIVTKELSRPVNYAELDPKKIAEKIDETYNKDISKLSLKAREYAESISWKALTPKYLELCQK